MNTYSTPKTDKQSTRLLRLVHLYGLALLLMSTKCGKDNPPPEPQEPTLPPATQTGANTFGCKVNGQVYVPNGNAFYPSIDQPSYHTSQGDFWIRTRNLYDFTGMHMYIYIYIKNGVYQTGTYPGYEDDIHPCLEKHQGGGPSIFKYYLDTTQNHFIEITRLDIENKIVSGLFEFTCFSETQQDTFKITEGRFDVGGVVVQP